MLLNVAPLQDPGSFRELKVPSGACNHALQHCSDWAARPGCRRPTVHLYARVGRQERFFTLVWSVVELCCSRVWAVGNGFARGSRCAFCERADGQIQRAVFMLVSIC